MTVDHSLTRAAVVYEIEDQTQFNPPGRAAYWPLQIGEVLALAATLRDAGYQVGAVLTKTEAISDAVNEASSGVIDRYFEGDLLALDPAEVADRVRQAGIDRACYLEMTRIRDDFNLRLARDAAASLHAVSDDIVTEMCKAFGPAVEAVQTAADHGLRPDTDVAGLLDTAKPATIAAYRDLAPAVATLDRIAGLRTQMATVAGIGPRSHPVACFITDVASLADLEGAEHTWRGQVETVQYDLPFTGSTLAKRRRPRLGGPWLALTTAGFRIRLNSGSEADNVLAAATTG
jgi:hypothetical protein